MRGGGSKIKGTFPKIHLFWQGKASLTVNTLCLYRIQNPDCQTGHICCGESQMTGTGPLIFSEDQHIDLFKFASLHFVI